MSQDWALFEGFVTREKALGGPDPQLDTLVVMTDADERTALWQLGCFAATYAVGPAEVLWQHWDHDTPPPEQWLRERWEGLPLRRERRAVRTPVKLARCLESYSAWAAGFRQEQQQTWEQLWGALTPIWGMGRYINLKLAELLHRRFGTPAQDSLMAAGGWSPRKGMASLYPEHSELLLGGDTAAEVAAVEELATQLRATLAERGIRLSWFELQVFLCEYKQAMRAKKYPGRSHDTELTYWRTAQSHFGSGSTMLEARARLFPPEVLGEQQCWMGARKECERTMVDHGYLWSDLEYDYMATFDFARPVAR
jgi:hypothetical protein